MFRHIVLMLASVLACSAQAGVYRWVDPQGGVHFGDTPPAEGAEPIRLQGQRLPDKSKTVEGASTPVEADAKPDDGSHTQLTIVQPAQSATVQSAGGEVVLQVMLEPKLQADDYLEVTLDGAVVGGKQSSNVMVLQSVTRGRHALQVSVFDADGKRLASSEEVRFYLRKSSPSEREGAEQDYQEWLTEMQREREAAAEAERREQYERQLREQAEQKARVEERRRSDFEAKSGDSPLLKGDYPEVPTTKTDEPEKYKQDGTDLQAPERPASAERRNELQTYDPAAIPKQPSGESGDFDPQNAPKSEPIKPYTGSAPDSTYAPNYTPPPAPSSN